MVSAGDLVIPGMSCIGALIFIILGVYMAVKASKCKSGDDCSKTRLGTNAAMSLLFGLIFLSGSACVMALMKQ